MEKRSLRLRAGSSKSFTTTGLEPANPLLLPLLMMEGVTLNDDDDE